MEGLGEMLTRFRRVVNFDDAEEEHAATLRVLTTAEMGADAAEGEDATAYATGGAEHGTAPPRSTGRCAAASPFTQWRANLRRGAADQLSLTVSDFVAWDGDLAASLAELQSACCHSRSRPWASPRG